MTKKMNQMKHSVMKNGRRSLAMLLGIVMLITAIGSGSVLSTLAETVTAGVLSTEALENADAAAQEFAEDAADLTDDADEPEEDVSYSDLDSVFGSDTIMRAAKADLAGTGWDDASTGIVFYYNDNWNWFKVSNAYANITFDNDMNSLHYQVVVSNTWYGNKSGSNNTTFSDSESYDKEYYAERDSTSYDLSANFPAGKYVFHLKAEPANNQAKYELYRKKALYDGGDAGSAWTNGQNMVYDGSTNDGDRYKMVITGDGNRKQFRTRYVDGPNSNNYRPYGNGGQTGSANAVDINIGSGDFDSFADGYSQKTQDSEGNPDNYFYFDTRSGYTYTIYLQGGKVWLVTDDPGTTPLGAPVVSISSSAANAGDTVTLSWASVANATSYEIFKDGVSVTEVNTTSYQITNNADADDAGVYTVKAKSSNALYTTSDASNEVTLTFMAPCFYLVGDVGTQELAEVNGEAISHATYGPDTVAYEGTNGARWTTPYTILKVDDTNTDKVGKYKITVKTKDVSWKINVGLFMSTDGSTGNQYGFKIGDRYYNKPNADYPLPYAGITSAENCYAIKGSGSIILPKNTEVTIYVDQTDNNKITVETNRVDVKTVARVKNYNIALETPALSDPVNATAAVGTATVAYDDGTGNIKPATATLTATVNDSTNYQFDGWYTDAACTTRASFAGNTNASVTLTGIDASVTYYALFTEKAAQTRTYTITVDTDHGAFGSIQSANCVGHISGVTTGSVYKGGTLCFTVNPDDGYDIDTVTTNTGSVSHEVTDTDTGQSTVTISNITVNATINITFRKAPTYELTLNIPEGDDSTYGSNFTVSYKDEDGQDQTDVTKASGNKINVITGTTVSITANAASGGTFDGWHLEGTYQRNSATALNTSTITIKPGSDMTLTAYFKASAGGGGGTASNYTINFTNGDHATFYQYNNASLGALSNWQNKTIYVAEYTATASNSWTFDLKYSSTYTFLWESSGRNVSPDNDYWPKTTSYNSNCNTQAMYTATKDQKYYFYLFLNKSDNGVQKDLGFRFSTTNLLTGGTASRGDDDSFVKSNYQRLYVLDGINNSTLGTNQYGTSVIISAASGVAKDNYYDVAEATNISNRSDAATEGAIIYYYDPIQNLDFRVQTTIADGHQALGVRAFVMNGMTYKAYESSNGVYYADITLDAEETNRGDDTYDYLEVIPVYYNKLIPDKDYIKFYVDGNTISGWGKTIGYSLWYSDTSLHGFEGGYPGQPLMSDGNLLYGYLPKYYVGNDATELPTAENYKLFAGVLLTNLAEHNSEHLTVLNQWENSSLTSENCNYQSFDYADPVEISQIGDSDMIEFVAKYKTLTTKHRYDTSLNSRTLNGATGLSWPASINSGSVPANETAAKSAGFEYLTDIDNNKVNIFNDHDRTLNGNPIYVVSAGNQQVSPNDWNTVWVVYDSSGTEIVAATPAEFINPSDSLQTTMASYLNSPVFINYEGWLAGESNSGTRLDGRWLYTRSSDPTNVRLRVATVSSGILTFSDDFIDWAEITDGFKNGAKETEDATNYTKLLQLDNRSTEVTAKINPVNYKVTGMYMLKASYADETDNGFSDQLSDYDALKSNGTAYSYTNTKNNRIVIVIEEVPAANMTFLHQLYGGPGAHNIDGIFKMKVELADSSKELIDPSEKGNAAIYGNFYTGTKELVGFTTDVPHYENDETTPVKYLKVTLRTEMYETTVFNQWYYGDNRFDPPYIAIDSTAAKGKDKYVETVHWIEVNDLYTAHMEEGVQNGWELGTRSLNFFSDLQSNATVEVNHLLKGGTTLLSANTYVHVMVINSSGEIVNDYTPRAQTTTVETKYLTKENAEAGYQLYVEIWNVPNTFCEFDKFWFPDGTTEMTTGTQDMIYYTNDGSLVSYNSNSYPAATATVPLSYFFKRAVNGDTIFDTNRKHFTLYSSVKEIGYHYALTYTYPAYESWFGNQQYNVNGDFTLEDLNEYMTFDGSGNLTFKEGKRATFLNNKAPYEDNFMKEIRWNSDDAVVSYNTENNTLSVAVGANTTDTPINVTLKLNYDNETDGTTHKRVAKKTDDNYTYKVAVVDPLEDVSFKYGEWLSFSENKSADYAGDAEADYLEAPLVVKDGETNYIFRYWKVTTTGDSPVEFTRCYYNKFNLSLFRDCVIETVYTAQGEGEALPNNAEIHSYDEQNNNDQGIVISFLEYSRNQYNVTNNSITPATRKDRGDRVYVDFLLNYNSVAKTVSGGTMQLKDLDAGTKYGGVIIEVVDTLTDTTNIPDPSALASTYGATLSDVYSNAQTTQADLEGIISNANAEASAKTETGKRSLRKTEFDVINLDNKNTAGFSYSFANRTHSDPDQYDGVDDTYLNNRNYIFRAYAYIKDADNNNIRISDPIYFTIYDVASIENCSSFNELS